MTKHMSNFSSAAAMVASGQMLPPYAPMVMPKQILSADVTVSGHVTSVLASLLSLLKPNFRDAN